MKNSSRSLSPDSDATEIIARQFPGMVVEFNDKATLFPVQLDKSGGRSKRKNRRPQRR